MGIEKVNNVKRSDKRKTKIGVRIFIIHDSFPLFIMSSKRDTNETCHICKMSVRNLAAHNKINHKKRKKSSGFTGPPSSSTSTPEIRERLPSCIKYQISNQSPRIKHHSSPHKKIPETDHGRENKKIKTEVPHSREESRNKSLSMLNQLLNEEEINNMIGEEESSRNTESFSFHKRISHKDRLNELGIERKGFKTGNFYADNRFKRCPTCNIGLNIPEGANRIMASYKIIEHIHECQKKAEKSISLDAKVDKTTIETAKTETESENKKEVKRYENPNPVAEEAPTFSIKPMTSIFIKNEPEAGIEPQVLLTEDIKKEVS